MLYKVLEIAKNEVGYLEKATNSMLESKTGNAGSNNYTKYGKVMGCNGDFWCDAFVDWCFLQAYGKEKAKKLLGGFSNYTPTSAQYFKNMGRYFKSPKVGDVIFFKNSTRICHTGLVYKVCGNKVYTIEGNTSSEAGVVRNGGAVAYKCYDLSNSRIAGYGRPNYSLVSEKSSSADQSFKKGMKVQTTSNLNLRENPTTESKIKTILNEGHKCTLKETKSGWGKVCIISKGQTSTGWISLKYVKEV